MIKFHLINVKTREIITTTNEKGLLLTIEKRDKLNKQYKNTYAIKMTIEKE